MLLPRLKKGDKWNKLPEVIDAICAAVESFVNAKPGPGLGKTPTGLLYVLESMAIGNVRPEDNSGGTTLALTRSNPTVTWSKADDNCPVSWIGNYVTWDATAYKFVQHERVCTYDRGGNLISIGAEVETDIIDAEECVPE